MNIIKQFFQSMTDPTAIAEYRNQSIAKTVLYVFLLSLIMFIPVFYPIYFNFDSSRESYDEFIAENNETIEFVDGKLIAKPVETYVHDGPGMTVVIDSTSDEIDTEVVTEPYVAFLEHELEINTGADEVSITYVELGLENISDEEFQSSISSASSLAFWIGAIILFWLMMLGSVITLSVFAILLRITTKDPEKPRNMKFSNYWTIAAYSTTIMAVFLAVMHSFGIQVVFRTFITWIVSFVIAYQAVKAVPYIDIEENKD